MKTIKVAIVGRPNVGKSTLFNRLYGRRRALVHDLPGVTRDRLIERTEWMHEGKPIAVTLIDTGGVGGEVFQHEVDRQVRIAVKEADVIAFVTDVHAGLTPADSEILRGFYSSGGVGGKKGTPLIGVANKVDNEKHEQLVSEFCETGIPVWIGVSAEHNLGIDELKALLIDAVEDAREEGEQPTEDERRDEIRLAIVGRPNVGKSTLVNTLCGEERMIVSDIAGTTVDAVDTPVEIAGRKFILVDTAGVRRKSKTEQGVEVLSVVQTKKALENCDVALLMLDASAGVTDQDEKIAGLIEEAGCCVILAVNKWDVARGVDGLDEEGAAEIVRQKMAFIRYAPLLFISGKQNKGVDDIAPLCEEVIEQRKRKVATHEFSEWVRKEATIHNPMNAKFYLCHQSGRHPPTFVCHVSDPKKIHFSLKRHLVNGIRKQWGFMGNPIRLLFTARKSSK